MAACLLMVAGCSRSGTESPAQGSPAPDDSTSNGASSAAALLLTPALADSMNMNMNMADGLAPGASVTFTVESASSGLTVFLEAPILAGESGSAFAVIEDHCTGRFLREAQTCTFAVQPVAVANGFYTATVTITDGVVRSNSATVAGTASGFGPRNPTVTIEQAGAQPDPVAIPPVVFDIVFSEAIDPTTFTVQDIDDTQSEATGLVWLLGTNDNIAWTLTATDATKFGTVIPRLDASRVVSAQGLPNEASTSADNSVTLLVRGVHAVTEEGLVARYFLDEAGSGMLPTHVIDASGHGLHLPLKYVGTGMNYTKVATGRGLLWTAIRGSSGACRDIRETPAHSRLHGSKTGSIEFVIDIADAYGQGGALWQLGEGTAMRFSVVYYGGSALKMRLDAGGHSSTRGYKSIDLGAQGRTAMTLVYDTAQADPLNRLILYQDGARIALNADSGYPVQDAALNVGRLGTHLCIGNHRKGRFSPRGKIYYGAYYNRALSPAEVAGNHAMLLLDDDFVGDYPPAIERFAARTLYLAGAPRRSIDFRDLRSGSDTNATGIPLSYSCYYDAVVDAVVAPTVSCTQLAGVTFDEATGVFDWTPTYAQAGAYEFLIIADDGSQRDESIFVLRVSPDSGNLILNPGCENGYAPGDVYDWEEISGLNWMCRAEVAPLEGGLHFFPGVAADTVELRQDVSVGAYAAKIAQGAQAFEFAGYTRSYGGSDRGQIVVEYLDGADLMLASYDSGQFGAASWTLASDSRVAPVGTATIRIRLLSTRRAGNDNDGNYDALVLRAVSPWLP